MKWPMFLFVVACSSQPMPTCDELAKMVGQRRGSCTVAADPAGPSGCPFVIWAFCGDPAACPLGWPLGCDGNDANCHYEGDPCTIAGGFAMFDAVQTLGGRDGLIVQSGLECSFEACR